MRTSRHMLSMLAAQAALAGMGSLQAAGVDFADPEPRKPRGQSSTATAIRQTGKPPMNGKREVARRLRQMQNPDCVMNHPTVAARALVFPA